MKVTQFTLQNFRAIEHMELNFTTQTTALVGVNGVGKSSVLDALAIALSSMTARLIGQAARSRNMSVDDIHEKADFARLEAEIEWVGQFAEQHEHTKWAIALNRKNGKHPPERSSDLSDLKKFTSIGEAVVKHIESSENELYSLPMVVYFDVHRAVLEVPLKTTKKLFHKPSDAYAGALSHGGTDFRGFFEWFRLKEDAENERIRDAPSYRDMELDAVRSAVEVFTGFKNLRIRRSPHLRMTLCKSGTELSVTQLSDGEKCMLALVGDIARRLSLLNKGLSIPSEGRGIVLIDEIDLHLHPKWQRTVVASLERTFPNCQFIISTHSPQIIGELPPEGVILLKDGKSLGNPERSFGLSSSEVVEELMEGEARNVGVRDALREIELAIDTEDLAQAKILLARLQAKVGDIPEVLQAHSSITSIGWLEEDGA